MFYKVIEKEDVGSTIIPNDLIQDHVRNYDQTDEALMDQYRDAAINFAERCMNRSIGPTKIHASFSRYKARFVVPMGEVKSIDSITAYRDGVEIEVTNFRFNSVSDEVILNSEYSDCEDFHVIANVGWTAFEVPKSVIQGILQLITTFYEQREDQSFGVTGVEIPFSHRYLFDRWHIPAR
ncbi:head-tail connector protein [Aeromonas popoffii]|uniref:head-tail connector protein n=1 Tax=Aeromonas popoffii TaxID=70856 RepID=UPI0030D1A601